MSQKLRAVAALLVNNEHKLLIAKRPIEKPLGGLWEYPGGKVEKGESLKEALVRELKEEIGVTVDPNTLSPLTLCTKSYPYFDLEINFFWCTNWIGTPHGVEGQEIKWIGAKELPAHPMPGENSELHPFIEEKLRVSLK